MRGRVGRVTPEEPLHVAGEIDAALEEAERLLLIEDSRHVRNRGETRRVMERIYTLENFFLPIFRAGYPVARARAIMVTQLLRFWRGKPEATLFESYL